MHQYPSRGCDPVSDFDMPRGDTSYAALRVKVGIAVDAMIAADKMWSIDSIPRLRRAWLAAIDAIEREGMTR